MLLFGPPGVGKSHLISGLAHALIDAGKSVLFTRCSELVQRLQTARRDLRLAHVAGAMQGEASALTVSDPPALTRS